MPQADDISTTDLCIIEVDDDQFTETVGGSNLFPTEDYKLAFDSVKERYGDTFDFLIFVQDYDLTKEVTTPHYLGIQQAVRGIGLQQYNVRDEWNSKRLQGKISLGVFTNMGTLLEEIGHRWSVAVDYWDDEAEELVKLTPEGEQEWRQEFDCRRSAMTKTGRYLERRSSNKWRSKTLSDDETTYCDLDLYLMGLKPAEAVQDFTYIDDFEVISERDDGTRIIQGTPRTIDIEGIIDVEGERSPGYYEAQKSFRAAFVVLTRDRDAFLSSNQLVEIENLRRKLQKEFREHTDGAASLNTRLTERRAVTNTGSEQVKVEGHTVSSDLIYNGLGPIPVSLEIGVESIDAGEDFVEWAQVSNLEKGHLSPASQVGELTARVYKNGYFAIDCTVSQPDEISDLTFHWRATATG